MDRLVLWDVDGTLLNGGAAAREALERALEIALGRPIGAHVVRMSGKTDPGILAELAASDGVSPDEIDEVVAAALEALPHTFADVAQRFADGGHVLPGIPEVLERLHARGDVLQTLLTGNVLANGIGKVAAFGLERWFVPEVGAYGSDDPVRDHLVPIAVQRASDHVGRAFDPGAVWVVGDTPRDLACAQAGGVRCLLVATGSYSLAELDGLGADAVLPDLSDTDRVVDLVRSAA